MKNRYLYRAKRKDNGEWVEGSLITGVFIRLGKDIPYILCPDKADYDCFEDFSEENGIFEVEPSTICQCTGLKDKNGKLIWENDILICHGNPKDLVKAVFGEFCVINAETLEKIDRVIGWHYEVIPTDSLSKCEPFCISMPLNEQYVRICEFEVIGNIFDNKDLTEV